MGVRAHAPAPPPRVRPAGPGFGGTLVVVLVALALLLANGRPVGTPDASGVAGWLLRGGTTLAALALELDATGALLVGKALAALFASLAAGALFAAVVRRHGTVEGRWAGLLLALGTTLAAAAQAWSGEAAATCAVALAVLLLVRSEEEGEAGPAVKAGLPLGLAAALQPSTAALALVLVGAVLVRWRREGLLVLAWAAPGTLLALALPALRRAPRRPSPGAAALLVSPAKGAFVFAPVALVGLAGLLRALLTPSRRLSDQPQPGRLFPIACGLAVAAHLAWLAGTGAWAAGDFWGPRWVAPAWPLLLLFLPEGFALLKVGASLLAVVSVAVQALGAFTYDGRWDRLYRGPEGGLGAMTWDLEKSPIALQARERVAHLARPGLEGRRLVQRERVLAPAGASGSFVSFAKTPARPTGVDATMSAVRLEGGARVTAARLSCRPRATAWRSAFPRGPGRGASSCGSPAAARAPSASARAAAAGSRGGAIAPSPAPSACACRTTSPESGGPDLRVSLRSGGPIALDSVSLVPPTEPDSVLRLP